MDEFNQDKHDDNEYDERIVPLYVGKNVSDNFWDGFYVPPKREKKDRLRFLFTALVCIAMLLCGVFITIVAVRGNGVFSKWVRGKDAVNFTLPLNNKPKTADKENIVKDGKYTAQGISEHFSDCVVSIEIFTKKSGFSPASQGSGIIMSSGGYIVTNAHVIEGAEKGIKVVLKNKDQYKATVVGKDTKTDIAVLKISAMDLKAAEFGDSSEVKVGEEVVAIGSPAGYYGSVTKGVVSGLHRDIVTEGTVHSSDCIQIDAAINPGNSGGALFNMYGQVIGITSSKLVSENYEGIGFAISSGEAKPIIEELMEKGNISGRAMIGITLYKVTKSAADVNGVKPGFCVVSISDLSDAKNTELAPGDIITEIDGKSLEDVENISAMLKGKKAGDSVSLKVFRKDYSKKTDTFTVKIKLIEDNGELIIDENNDDK